MSSLVNFIRHDVGSVGLSVSLFVGVLCALAAQLFINQSLWVVGSVVVALVAVSFVLLMVTATLAAIMPTLASRCSKESPSASDFIVMVSNYNSDAMVTFFRFAVLMAVFMVSFIVNENVITLFWFIGGAMIGFAVSRVFLVVILIMGLIEHGVLEDIGSATRAPVKRKKRRRYYQ